MISRFWLCLLALGFLAGCDRQEPQVFVPPAYVERIQPKNYADAEALFPEAYSKTYQLVFLRTDAGKAMSVVALNRDAAGGYNLLFASLTADGTWGSVTSSLDESTGGQLLRAVEYRLHRNITLSQTHRDVKQREGDLWICQQLTEGGVACALITFAARLNSEPGALAVYDLLDLLQRLAAAEPEQRDDLLSQIDRAASAEILTESGRK